MTASQKQRGERQALLSLAIMMEWPIRIAGVLSSLLIFVSFCLMIFAIFQRYFLNTPLKWGDEMLGYLLVAIVMSGVAEALRRGDHVAIDLLTSFFGIKIQAFLTYLSHTAVLAFAVIFGISADEVVRFSYDFGSYSPGYLEAPMWLPQSAMIAGSVLLGLGALAGLVRSFCKAEA